MKSFLIVLIPILFFNACKSDKEKSNEKFTALVEKLELNSFINIEYVTSGETETYHYFMADTVYTSWEYDNLTKKYGEYDLEKMKLFTAQPLKYMEELRVKIKSLKVDLISQTQWHSQVIKFWIGDAEYFTYVHPDFKFDAGEKTLLENELKNSDKINENWYYKKMIVCTNK